LHQFSLQLYPNQAHSVGQLEEQLSSESLVPPEEQLIAPPTPADTPETVTQPATEVSASLWLVVAKNRRVNRDWEALYRLHKCLLQIR
jgi:hypothetical protein